MLEQAIGNGHPVSALLGRDSLRAATSAHFLCGAFWTSAVPLAASLATLRILEAEGAAVRMAALGETRAKSWAAAAAAAGLYVNPSHNWFISSALESADLNVILNAPDAGFATVAGRC